MNDFGEQLRGGLSAAWTTIMVFVPRLLLFAVILVIGYFVAKLLCRVVDRLLEKLGFDRLVERGPIKRAMDRTRWDASDILAKIVFYFVMLFTLQLAFGTFGPNPVSDLLTRIVAYLPNIFVAAVIVVIAGAIATGVKQLIGAAIGGTSLGRFLATAAAVAIWVIGAFAALNQLNIAPDIINGLFYALLAIVAGSAIIAIGGGGILPMRSVWERILGRLEREAPRLRAEASGAGERAQAQAQTWEHKAEQAAESAHEERHPDQPRFRTP